MATATVFAPVSSRQSTSTEQGTSLISEKQKCVLDSSFLLLGFFTQHGLHDSDFSALSAVDIRGEIKNFCILTSACRIKQVFHHYQSAIVVLDHSGQKQTVKVFAFRLSQGIHLLRGKHSRHQHLMARHIHARHVVHWYFCR